MLKIARSHFGSRPVLKRAQMADPDRQRSRSPPWHSPEVAAKRWRADVVDAVTWKKWHLLAPLARRAVKLTVTREILEGIGIGRLITDKTLWEKADSSVNKLVVATEKKWKTVAANERLFSCEGQAVKKKAGELVKLEVPLCGYRAAKFLDVVSNVQFELQDAVPTVAEGHREAAVALVLRGMHNVDDLSCLTPIEVSAWSSDEPVAMVLSKACERATVLARRRLVRARTEFGLGDDYGCPRLGHGPLSAGDQANALMVVKLDEKLVDLGRRCEESGVLGLGTTTSPAQLPDLLARADAAGADVKAMLKERSKCILLHTRKGSLKGAASALRAWHGFAKLILNYSEEATLPPRSPQDVAMWLACFRSAGTAANYLSFLKWTCEVEDLDTSWYGPRLPQITKGLAKVDLGGVKKLFTRALLDTGKVNACVEIADALGDNTGWQEFALTAWSLLLRVKSELVKAEVGTPDEVINLPEFRHSALYVSDAGVLTFRLAKRKNMPRGSVLRRPCTCGVSGPKFCAPHRIKHLIDAAEGCTGDLVFDFTAPAALARLKRYLVLAGVENAEAYTLKSFRAGRATEMAGEGCTLPALLEAGEWHSRAVFNYLDLDVVDHAQMFKSVVENSDAEDSGED